MVALLPVPSHQLLSSSVIARKRAILFPGAPDAGAQSAVDGVSTVRTALPLLSKSGNGGQSDDDENDSHRHLVDTHSDILDKRLIAMRAHLYEQKMKLPPNPNLSPTEFVSVILAELRRPDYHMPQLGFRTLLRSSSEKWKNALINSIGVPEGANPSEDQLISALASAMSRPHNQYQILVEDSNDASFEINMDDAGVHSSSSNSQSESKSYALYFPGDVVDYLDGQCWLETQLRHPKTGKLLCIIGWSLVQNDRKEWLVDRIDWQDFRDEFRPGIGREEWMRICG